MAGTACHVCFPDAFDQGGPLLDQRGSCACESAARGRYLAEREPARFPVSAQLPSVLVTATFCRRVVSWRGVLFGHNRTRPPPYMGWRGPWSAYLIRLASFPARPAPAADRRGQVPARSAGFPALPTSPELPPGGTRFRRPPGPNTRTKCRFPSSSHVPGVAPGWCPFPATARAKHPREVPVSQLLPRPRSLLQVVPVSGGE